MAGVVTARVNSGKKVMTEESFTWFAGVDWGSEKHHACIIDTRGTVVGERQFPHSGVGLAELGDWLLSIAGTTATVAVAIEVPHGPVVDSLIDRGFVEDMPVAYAARGYELACPRSCVGEERGH